MGDDTPTTTGRGHRDDGSPAGRRVDPLRDVLLPAMLALAIMLAVWWYWQRSVVDVGTHAARQPPSTTPDTRR